MRGTFFQHAILTAAVALGGGTLLSPETAAAQQSDAQSVSQIVTVDRQGLFNLTAYGKRVLASVETERERLVKETHAAEQALAEEERELTEQRATLDPQSFRVLADAFDRKVRDLRRESELREQEFVRTLENEQSAFFDRIGPILGELVRELGAVVILDRRVILLSTRNIDITELAVQRINDRLGDGSDGQTTPPTQGSTLPSDEPETTTPVPDDAN